MKARISYIVGVFWLSAAMFCVMVWLREGGSSILRGGFLDGGGGGRRMRVFSAVVLFVRKKNCRSIRFVHVAVSLGL